MSRDLTVTSEPVGAIVHIDGLEVGPTPVTIPFRYGGERDLLLLLQGYRPTQVTVDTERLGRDQFPLDLWTDTLGSEDHQVVHVVLEREPDRAALRDYEIRDRVGTLLDRADVLRRRARSAQEGLPPPVGPSDL